MPLGQIGEERAVAAAKIVQGKWRGKFANFQQLHETQLLRGDASPIHAERRGAVLRHLRRVIILDRLVNRLERPGITLTHEGRTRGQSSAPVGCRPSFAREHDARLLPARRAPASSALKSRRISVLKK